MEILECMENNLWGNSCHMLIHAYIIVLYLYAMYVAIIYAIFSVLTGSHVKSVGLILNNFSLRMSMQKYPDPWSTQVNIEPSYPYMYISISSGVLCMSGYILACYIIVHLTKLLTLLWEQG